MFTFELNGGNAPIEDGTMSDVPAGGAEKRRPPDLPTCNHCGGLARPMPILDTRQGKIFRLLRCLSCEKVCWTEER
jgi:hypothetical protein